MTTGRKRPPRVAGAGGNAEVVSIAAWADYRRRASARVAGARERLGMTHAEYAAHLTSLLGWRVTAGAVENWEGDSNPPGDVIEASIAAAEGTVPVLSLLDPVPGSFHADALAGPWVTAYQFAHAGGVRYHADVAHVIPEGEREVRAVNHPPEPRTQGRASPFRNEIEGRLFGRHLIGTWRNTSDTRYYGSLHLAVLPGETVMDGHYTGLASDISVSAEHWRWVRLDPEGPCRRDPAGALRRLRARHDPNAG